MLPLTGGAPRAPRGGASWRRPPLPQRGGGREAGRGLLSGRRRRTMSLSRNAAQSRSQARVQLSRGTRAGETGGVFFCFAVAFFFAWFSRAGGGGEGGGGGRGVSARARKNQAPPSRPSFRLILARPAPAHHAALVRHDPPLPRNAPASPAGRVRGAIAARRGSGVCVRRPAPAATSFLFCVRVRARACVSSRPTGGYGSGARIEIVCTCGVVATCREG